MNSLSVNEPRTRPNEQELRVLLAMSCTVPMKSSELALQAGLPASELRLACKWLSLNGYVLRRLKHRVGNGRVFRRIALWELTQVGLSSSATLGSASVSPQFAPVPAPSSHRTGGASVQTLARSD